MKITRFKFYGKWRWRTPGPSGKGWRALTAKERKEAFGRKWMHRQTICLRIAVKKKYYSFRFSEYRKDKDDLLSQEDLEKRAFKYFGRQIGKYSGNRQTYDKADIEAAWKKYELGIEKIMKLPYDARAIGFEQAET